MIFGGNVIWHYHYLEGVSSLQLLLLCDLQNSESGHDFNMMISDPHSRYVEPTGGSDFNQIGGHGFQHDDIRSSL